MNLYLLGLSFITVFLAELADRSSVAAFALSTSSKFPRAIFFGAASALLSANFLGAFIGGKVAELIPVQAIKIIAALGFAFLAIRLLWKARTSRKQSNTFTPPSPSKLSDKSYDGSWTIFSSTFVTILLASMGDQEQITTLLLSAQSGSPLIVFFGAALAVMSTSLIAVLLGQGLARWLPPKVLKSASGVILLLVSIWLLLDVLHHGELELFDADDLLKK